MDPDLLPLPKAPLADGCSPQRDAPSAPPQLRGTHLGSLLPQLLAQARRLTRNESDAQDLVRDTYARALTKLSEGDEAPNNPGALMRVIQRNAWFNTVQSRRAHAAADAAMAQEQVGRTLLNSRVSRPQLPRIWLSLPEQRETFS